MRVLGVLLLGVSIGLQYSLLAMGLVLIYRSGRFVNFGQAQLGVFAAIVLARLVIEAHVPYVLGLMAGLATAALTGLILERSVIQKLFEASRLTVLIATIAMAQGLFGLTQFHGLHIGRTEVLPASPLLLDQALVARHKGGYPTPFAGSLTVGGVVLGSGQLLTLLLTPLMALGFWYVFSATRFGRAMRAASSNSDAARLAGISPRRISMLVWIIAAVLSGLTAVLAAPAQPTIITTAQGPGLLLRGLAAAMLAGFVDFRLAFLGGVGVGVVEQTVQYNVHTPGATELAVMAVLLAGVVIRGRTLSRTARRGDDMLMGERSPLEVPDSLRYGAVVGNMGRVGWALLALVLSVLPLVPGLRSQAQAQALTEIMVFALVGVSMTVLVGWAGQVSLGHYALMGVGAYVAAQTAHGHHWALPAVMLVAGGVTAGAALVIGLPALWFRGLFLAVTTLGLAVVAQAWLFYRPVLGADGAGSASFPLTLVHIPIGGWLASYRQAYWLTVVVLMLVVAGLRALRASGAGRILIAVRDNEAAASTSGFSPIGTKAAALCLSGFIVGVAGALFAVSQSVFVASEFDPVQSLVMLSVVIVGGLGTLVGPVLGAFAVFAWPLLLPHQNNVVVQTFSSTSLVLVVLLYRPGGLASGLEAVQRRLLALVSRIDGDAGPVPDVETVVAAGLAPASVGSIRPDDFEHKPRPRRPEGITGRVARVYLRAPLTGLQAVDPALPLHVEGLSLSFGGIRPLDDVSMQVRRGEIVGLIGGNGAGKTTLLNCVSGLHKPQAGTVRVFGSDVTDLPPQFRPALGVGRSYQDAALYRGLTVLETAQLGLESEQHTGIIGAVLGAPWVAAAERRKEATARQSLELFGLETRARTLTTELSTGMRRLADLAALMTWAPALVLLDEPTAGIAQREVEQFGDLLISLRDRLGCSVILIEHDMPLVMSVSDRVYCLGSGKVIAEGSPAEVSNDPAVISSYLGTDQTAIERSSAVRPAARVQA